MDEYLKENKIYFGESPKYSNVPRIKIYQDEYKDVIVPNVLDKVGTSKSAQVELEILFGDKVFFDSQTRSSPKKNHRNLN